MPIAAGPPRATYRVQLRAGTDLRSVRRELPYLDRLGIDTLYLSPLFLATPGSAHGYDGLDPTRVDPALGGLPALRALARSAHARGLRVVLDIVPNHLAADPRGAWWRDVLARGRASRFAPVFDLEEGDGGADAPKIVLPFLRSPLGTAIARGELAFRWDAAGPRLELYGVPYPLAPRSLRRFARRDPARRLGRAAPPSRFPELDGRTSAGRRALARLLGEQEYRFVPYWATRQITYRRFFDIAGLIGVRMDRLAVFRRTHAAIFRWIEEGLIDGLRVDHVDGWLEPTEYLRRLARRPRGLRSAVRGPGPPAIWVEKVLAEGERIPDAWPVRGTTGYEAMRLLTGIFVDPGGLGALDALFRARTGEDRSFEAVAFRAKTEMARRLFPHELHRLAGGLLPEEAPARRRAALAAFTAGLGVYRTYLGSPGAREEDRRWLAGAEREALHRGPRAARGPVRRLRRRLARRIGPGGKAGPLQRWQSWSGAVAAKGVEDTALYRYPRLLALNEVGSSPGGAGVPVAEFHRAMRERAARDPLALTATTTHDTKWGEEVRARLSVLSERPELWREILRSWDRSAGRRSGLRDRDRYLLEQAAFGAFPWDPRDLARFPERFVEYARKALRETRQGTDWMRPNAAYEAAGARYARALADPRTGLLAARDRRACAEPLVIAGFYNALGQVLLKVTVPGIPDFYQGSELSAAHLVDPDNRRPVDRGRIARVARRCGPSGRRASPDRLRAWSRRWWDGTLRFYLTRRLLEVRRADPELFARGSYSPLATTGAGPMAPVAFARVLPDRWALIVVGRGLAGRPPASLRGARVRLPAGAPASWQDALTAGPDLPVARGGGLPLGELLTPLPFALGLGRTPRAQD
jgi:(1->4)-alpha-D-glucan 1-alpha-D-glucosylmutase